MSSLYTSKAISLKDFYKLCRTCLGHEKLNPIPGTLVDDMKIEDLFEYSLMIEVNQNDFLPQNICENCIIALYKTYEFKKLSQDNEYMLKLLLQKEVNKEKSTNTFIEETRQDKEYNVFEEHNYTKIGSHSSFSKDDIFNQFEKLPLQNSLVEHIKVEVSETQKVEIDENYTKIESDYDSSFSKDEICSEFEKLPVQNYLDEHIKAEMETQMVEIDEKFLVVDVPHKSVQKENNVTSLEGCNLGEDLNNKKTREPIKSILSNFKCVDCEYISSSKEELTEHWKSATHGQCRKFRCEICHKEVKHKDRAEHVLLHTLERSYKCEVCPQRYTTRTHLKRHKMIHTNPKRLMDKSQRELEARDLLCDICGRAFKTKEMLKGHQLCHREKSFLCSDCGKCFAAKTSFLSHLKVHTEEKPYTCTICKKSFSRAAAFKRHMLIHKGLKPYKCKFCSKRFTQSHHLVCHLRTHSGEKPYTCTYCNKSFALKGNLTVHIRTHTGETPFVCPVCGKGFHDSSNMKRHRQKHKEGAKPQIKPHPQQEESEGAVCDVTDVKLNEL